MVPLAALILDDGKEIVSTTFAPRRAAQKFTKIMPEHYNLLVPPTTETGDPIKAEFSLLIMSMRGVYEMDQEISLEMNLRAFWRDRRLANVTSDKEFLVLHPTAGINHLWIPDVFIDHAKGIKQTILMSKPTSLRLHNDGRVRYSARVAATIQCPMNFKYYPADTPKCRIELKSYVHPNDMLKLIGWERHTGVVLAEGVSLANLCLIVEKPHEFFLDTSSGSRLKCLATKIPVCCCIICQEFIETASIYSLSAVSLYNGKVLYPMDGSLSVMILMDAMNGARLLDCK